VLALWLLIRPPSVPGDEGTVIRPQPTPQVTPAGTRGPTQRPGVTATPGPSGEASPTPGGTGGPTGTPAPTEAGPIEYTVQDGDTWFGIAEAFGVDAENLAAVNGLTLDDFLQPGDVLVIPQ
jgi:LysM repeat protein